MNRRNCFIFAALAALLLSSCASAPLSSRAATPDPLLNELTAMRTEIQTLQADLGIVKETVTSLNKMITARINGESKPPAVSRISLDDDPVLGNSEARVAIVEFSDYQCPFCRTFHTRVFPVLKTNYIDTGKVKFVYRDLALNFHPEAENAAIAANCAGEQHAYWRMNERLFQDQERLGAELYKELAKEFGLDAEAFESCLADARHRDEIGKDLKYAESIGVDGTPVFFIGIVEGNEIVDVQQIVGAQPPALFAQIIEAYLRKASKPEPAATKS